jgi:hypothetical protein
MKHASRTLSHAFAVLCETPASPARITARELAHVERLEIDLLFVRKSRPAEGGLAGLTRTGESHYRKLGSRAR